MGLTQLRLSHFRSYAHLHFECDPRPVVLTGHNGAGKTNILEALSFLSPGRGLRGIKSSEALHINAQGEVASSWAVATVLAQAHGPIAIGTGLDTQQEHERRVVHINKTPVKSKADLTRYVNILWLTPQMDRILSDGVVARRRFLDRLVYSLDSTHAARILRYEHVMRERMRLLKSSWSSERSWLTALEQKMAAEGIALTAARLQTVATLTQAREWSLGIFPKAGLVLEGDCERDLAQGSALEAEDKLIFALAKSRSADSESGRTLVGPHRSDLKVTFIEKNIPAEQCSTGEQKALLTSIIIAASRLQALRGEAVPLILLDEVMAHLDEVRRHALFTEILNLKMQTWMTGTDPRLFKDFKDQIQHFEIADSTLKRL
jgi:DNA replication and repair protein RecF